MQVEQLRNTLAQADRKRQAQQWQDAIALYRQLELQLAGQGAFHHNLALCLLGVGEPAQALSQAERALAAQPALWQSSIVKARALKALGRWPEAALLLQTLAAQQPQRGEFVLEHATLALHELCDADLARRLVQPWLAHPVHGTDARLTDLMASLYEPTRADGKGCDKAQHINTRALQFAQEHLGAAAHAPAAHLPDTPAPGPVARRRLRVGLLSPLLSASPVYFFCSGALALLKDEFELCFFSRSRRNDWATQRLRAMASLWVDVTDLSAPALQAVLRQHALDVLVDLGGWTDPIALQALANKPVARQYKWVGGQSISTGLRSFDGYLSDAAQTPAGHERWYSEPLVRLPCGYVTYTPPAYLPAPVPAPVHAHVLGIVSNPVKVSQPFLAALGAQLHQPAAGLLHASADPSSTLVLRFIDRRYSQPAVRARLRSALQPALAAPGRQVQIEFVAPSSHLEYLQALGGLSEMLDTFPYAGGLTTIEALSLGVPCSTVLAPRTQKLFCERHTLAHLHFLQSPGARRKRLPHVQPGVARTSLLQAGCPRSDHAALAASLARLFSHGTLEEAA